MYRFWCGVAVAAMVQLSAQDPTAALEGLLLDRSGGTISRAVVVATDVANGFRQQTETAEDGTFRFPTLPVGRYRLRVEKEGFAAFEQTSIQLSVGQTARLEISLQVAGSAASVTVAEEDVPLADSATNTLGKVVTTREVLDLPLNGRNFAQLGLLQAGVAPLPNGLLQAGGTLRAGQGFAVNGQRPESNSYRFDGASNVNRMDGGFALRVPVDAIQEFRILTHTAPAEFGGTSGSITMLVTKAGGNTLHGSAYGFLRNDVLDARNFFSARTEPLKQAQYGATAGGALRKNRSFLFGYYEGFRNRQGVTRSSVVATEAQRRGDYSGRPAPLLDFSAGGLPFPGNRLPVTALHPISLNVMERFIPLGNLSPATFRSTVITENDVQQGGFRFDHRFSDRDQLFVRYSYSDGGNVNPISIRGSDLPGFPVRDDQTTSSATVSETHLFSPRVVNSLRLSFFRSVFFFDQRLNQISPRELGFQYDSASRVGQSAPFFNINGYSPVGGAITGPRNSWQTDGELGNIVSVVSARHSWKAGVEARWTQLNAYQGIAPNAFFVFTPSFPTNDGFANFLLGRPLVFYQGLGDLTRGLRNWQTSAFLQDEWRVNRRLTLNLGLRYEAIPPFTEVRDRLNTFVPGVQSQKYPEAPLGVLFPGDPGVAKGLAPVTHALLPRVGFAFNPDGRGRWVIRAAYGVFFDTFANGQGAATQAPVSSLPWTQLVQFSGPGTSYANPYGGRPLPAPGTFLRPATVVGMSKDARAPYAQNWNLSLQRALGNDFLIEARYTGTKGTHLPRNIEANPAVWGPGATAQNADRRRLYANCPADGAACQLVHVALLSTITNSNYHAAQLLLTKRLSRGWSWSASYWWSKTIDELSAMNLTGAAARPLSGEVDIAQNPFDLRAERGASLFDARHRFVFSGSWEIPTPSAWRGAARRLLSGWQWNGIATAATGTPFTVFDSANVAGQASHPPISGFSGSRPDLVGDPMAGPRTAEQWLSRQAFRRLNPITEAGRFGSAGRNIARADGIVNLDMSLFKSVPVSERTRLQFRFEAFNLANHATLGVPVSDLASPSFGRVLDASAARTFQAALKLLF